MACNSLTNPHGKNKWEKSFQPRPLKKWEKTIWYILNLAVWTMNFPQNFWQCHNRLLNLPINTSPSVLRRYFNIHIILLNFFFMSSWASFDVEVIMNKINRRVINLHMIFLNGSISDFFQEKEYLSKLFYIIDIFSSTWYISLSLLRRTDETKTKDNFVAGIVQDWLKMDTSE